MAPTGPMPNEGSMALKASLPAFSLSYLRDRVVEIRRAGFPQILANPPRKSNLQARGATKVLVLVCRPVLGRKGRSLQHENIKC